MFLLKITTALLLLASAELCSGFYTSNRVNLKGRFTSKLFMSSKYLGTEPVFVAGGSSGVGLEVIRKLSALGTPVRALVRREESRDLLQKVPGVTVVLGDALDESAVQNCMTGCVAAITTLGGSPSDGQIARVYYEGNSNVIEQAGILGVERIVLVTSVGCGDTAGAIAVPVYQALETFLVAKTRAERDLKRYTNLDWTIIRPGGLKDGPRTGRAILTQDNQASGFVHRADVADVIVQVLGCEDGRCTRKEFTVVDPVLKSGYEYKPFSL